MNTEIKDSIKIHVLFGMKEINLYNIHSLFTHSVTTTWTSELYEDSWKHFSVSSVYNDVLGFFLNAEKKICQHCLNSCPSW